MQGVVFGTRIDQMADDPLLRTRLDFDQAFGTAVNRFCCQAVIDHPLTLFGAGTQRRGFLPLRDSMQCLTLALENPAEPGEHRVFNQFEETYNVAELAAKVQDVASIQGMDVQIRNLQNPRREKEDHYYNPDHQRLLDLGYKPTRDVDGELALMLEDLLPQRDRILAKREVLIPDIRWTGDRARVSYLDSETSSSAGVAAEPVLNASRG
ncbi:MAG: hypothetical protein JOZ39_03485, partial [Chloroflexi bacterium]|nr:hypothetical protein [Chloroflexota bacterium]